STNITVGFAAFVAAGVVGWVGGVGCDAGLAASAPAGTATTASAPARRAVRIFTVPPGQSEGSASTPTYARSHLMSIWGEGTFCTFLPEPKRSSVEQGPGPT